MTRSTGIAGPGRPLAARPQQGASFAEVFFDLMTVFALLQVAALLREDLSWAGMGRSLMVLWLVWAAWSQYTWALDAADTTHPFVELGTLVATAVAYFMALGIPDAFAGRAPLFAVPYVLLRTLGLWTWVQVVRLDAGRRPLPLFAVLASPLALVALLAGAFAGPALQTWLWGLAIALDLGAAASAARLDDDVRPERLAERHGIVVVAGLAGALVAASVILTGLDFTGDVVPVAALAVLIGCALWWTYFPVASPELERAIASLPDELRGARARDAYAVAHFPIVAGIVSFRLTIEDAIVFSAGALPDATRLSLGLTLLLFVGGTGFALWLAGSGRSLVRVSATAIAAGLVLALRDAPAVLALLLSLAALALIAVVDERAAHRLGLGG